MKSKPFLTQREYDGLSAIVDLGQCVVADAEQDHMDYKKVSRRNSGYSADSRIAERVLEKLLKFVKEKK